MAAARMACLRLKDSDFQSTFVMSGLVRRNEAVNDDSNVIRS